jgi:hypothetical protein
VALLVNPMATATSSTPSFVGYGKIGHGTCTADAADATWCVTEKVWTAKPVIANHVLHSYTCVMKDVVSGPSTMGIQNRIYNPCKRVKTIVNHLPDVTRHYETDHLSFESRNVKAAIHWQT